MICVSSSHCGMFDAVVTLISNALEDSMFAVVVEVSPVMGVNEQWPGYWAERFARHGFQPVDILRPKIWEDDRVVWWYQQNILLYANESTLESNEVLKEAAANTPKFPKALVHPKLFLPRVDGRARSKDLRNLKFRRVVRALPFIACNSFLGFFRKT